MVQKDLNGGEIVLEGARFDRLRGCVTEGDKGFPAFSFLEDRSRPSAGSLPGVIVNLALKDELECCTTSGDAPLLSDTGQPDEQRDKRRNENRSARVDFFREHQRGLERAL